MRLANLDVAEQSVSLRMVLVVLALALAWRFRRHVDFVDGTLALANEWAAVCILVAMLSPMCWLQHMVLVVPAAGLLAHAAAAGELRRWQWCVGTFAAALALLIHRDLIGVACAIFSVVISRTRWRPCCCWGWCFRHLARRSPPGVRRKPARQARNSTRITTSCPLPMLGGRRKGQKCRRNASGGPMQPEKFVSSTDRFLSACVLW